MTYIDIVRDELTKYYDDSVLPNFTSDIKNSIRRYSHYDYIDINEYLLYPSIINNYYEKKVNLIRKGIKLCRTPFDLTVYHGTSSIVFDNEDINTFILNHKSFTFKPFLSTSLDINKAKNFISASTIYNRKTGIVLAINIPAGYPALWMNPLSFYTTENELLLSDHTELVIDKCERKGVITPYEKIYTHIV